MGGHQVDPKKPGNTAENWAEDQQIAGDLAATQLYQKQVYTARSVSIPQGCLEMP